jgi:hypothetical protein
MNTAIIDQISQKGFDKDKIAREVIKNPELLAELIEGLQSDKAQTRYGCEKVLRAISEQRPDVLYPYFDSFVKMLDSANSFLKWGAIITIGNLASLDSENKFEKIYAKYFAPVHGPVMITAANIIESASKIALAKPHLREKITKEILKVNNAKYQTDECRNVAIGHAIDSLDRYFEQIKNKKPVMDFVRQQLENTRAPVRKRAEKFVKKHNV